MLKLAAPQIAGTMPTLTVRDVVTLYLRHSKATGLHSPQALAEREHVFELFNANFGDMQVEDAKAFHLSDWIEGHPGWKSVSTRRAKANMIRAAFQWAVDGERINRHPFKAVRYDEAERRPDLPDSILEMVATLANKPFERAVRFLRLTGCRLSELARAKWGDIDLVRGIWTIDKHKSRKHTRKAKKVALVPEAVVLIKDVAKALAPLQSAEPTEAALAEIADSVVFTNTRGRPWTNLSLGKRFRYLKEKHHIQTNASLHGIRHRFGTANIAAGAPLKLVSMQMGHASASITEEYYCDLTEEIDAIRNAISLGTPKS